MPLQDTAGAATYDAFGGGPLGPFNYIEDVFSTVLYTGNGSTQTITNGIDLAGKGGLVWIKIRNLSGDQCLFDTQRGVGNVINSNSTAAQGYSSTLLSAFNSNGFGLGSSYSVNDATGTYASWTFRKAPKFFDVVTYTGNGSALTVNHNLGSVPGCIIVKNVSGAYSWAVYHRSNGNDKVQYLNGTQAASTSATSWNSYTPTSTNFQVGGNAITNSNGDTYVAYLFAHDAGGFGASGTDNVISCGSFTVDGSGNSSVTLGYEPQWLLMKQTNTTGDWLMQDTMRGQTADNGYSRLLANTSGAETSTTTGFIRINATGFSTNGATGLTGDHIYIAIRRGPMRTPTTGTSVFYPQTIAQADTIDSTGVPFPPDLVNTFSRNGTDRTALSNTFNFVDRLRGIGTPSNTYSASGVGLTSTSTAAEFATSAYVQLKADSQNITRGSGWNTAGYANWINYFFRRAPGFFDVVCYTGTGSAATVSHNLGVVPELMIVKRRSAAEDWWVYDAATGNTKYQVLNSTATPTTSSTAWNNITPTSSVFTVGTGTPVNASAGTYVAYLFATVAGVSKVFSYTGNGSSQTINCGFTAGARFVLIKRTDSTGDWYVWDSARGIVAGNDPHLSLNSTAAEVTTDDSVDTDNTGFVVNQVAATNVNVSSATYIGLAVA